MIDRLDSTAIPFLANCLGRGSARQDDFQKFLGGQEAPPDLPAVPQDASPAVALPEEPVAGFRGMPGMESATGATAQPEAVPGVAARTEVAGIPVEAKLLPWQLMPQGALSQLRRGMADDPAPRSTHAAIGPVLGEVHARMEAFAATVPAAAVAPAGSAGAVPHGVHSPAASGILRKTAEPNAAHLALAGMASPWTERLVRWVAEGNDGVTAWVRDYRLAESDIPALIRDLIEYGNTHDVQLARIVVNARERWRAPTHVQEFG